MKIELKQGPMKPATKPLDDVTESREEKKEYCENDAIGPGSGSKYTHRRPNVPRTAATGCALGYWTLFRAVPRSRRG